MRVSLVSSGIEVVALRKSGTGRYLFHLCGRTMPRGTDKKPAAGGRRTPGGELRWSGVDELADALEGHPEQGSDVADGDLGGGEFASERSGVGADLRLLGFEAIAAGADVGHAGGEVTVPGNLEGVCGDQRLKAEIRQLREDVAILKAATTFFAGELDPRNR